MAYQGSSKEEVFHSDFHSEESSQICPGEILLGSLVAIDDQGRPLVDFPSNVQSAPVTALTTVPIERSSIGRTVALLFANGDLLQPVIMGLIRNSLDTVLETTVGGENEQRFHVKKESMLDTSQEESGKAVESIKVDDERVVIEGQKEIVLKCGDASITLTRAGKILIRGKYLLNRSTGINRIMGGSVQVN